MSFVIEIYMIVCVALIIFDVVFIIAKNLAGKKVGGRNKITRGFLYVELAQYSPEVGIREELKSFLTKDILKTKNLVALQNALEEIEVHKPEILMELKPYILNAILEYKGKDEYEKAFYAYVVSCLSYEDQSPSEEFYKDFFTFLDSQSLYTFSNAMTGFYHFNDPYALNNAIKKVDQRGSFYHGKLFVDGLLEFSGDKQTLTRLLKDNFKRYSPSTQVSILNYFRQTDMDEAEFCIEVWKNRELSSEVMYAAMRYFAKYPTEESREECIEILRSGDSNWIEQLLAIKGLANQNDQRTRTIIESKVNHPNWHIRINAVGHLHSNGLDKHEILKMLQLRDEYTNDALLYHYREDEEITNFIIETVQNLREEKNELSSFVPEIIQSQGEGCLSV